MFPQRIVMGFLEVVRVIYLALIGLTPLEIGIITTIGTVVRAFQSFTVGMLSDRYGRKPFLLLGSVFTILRLALYATSRDFWMLALAQGLGSLGEGQGAGQPVVSGYIADKTSVRDRTRVFSTIAITQAISGTIGSLMGGLPVFFQAAFHLDAAASNIPLFWIGVALNASAFFLTLPIREERRTTSKVTSSPLVSPGASTNAIAKFSVVRATDGLAMGMISPLLPLYFYLRFGVGSEDLAPIYAAARFLPLFTFLIVPIVVDRFNNIRCLLAIRLVSGAVVTLFALSSTFPIAGALFVAYRVLSQFSMPVRQAFATEIVTSARTGTMIGVSNSARSFLQSVAPTIAGYLYESVSLTIPLFSGAALLATNGVQYPLLFGRSRGAETTNATTSAQPDRVG